MLIPSRNRYHWFSKTEKVAPRIERGQHAMGDGQARNCVATIVVLATDRSLGMAQSEASAYGSHYGKLACHLKKASFEPGRSLRPGEPPVTT